MQRVIHLLRIDLALPSELILQVAALAPREQVCNKREVSAKLAQGLHREGYGERECFMCVYVRVHSCHIWFPPSFLMWNGVVQTAHFLPHNPRSNLVEEGRVLPRPSLIANAVHVGHAVQFGLVICDDPCVLLLLLQHITS